MSSVYFNTAIVGGGPSGCSCGITLQQAHSSSCIIDCKKFPRHKLCAGLLTDKSKQILHSLLSTVRAENILEKVTCAEENSFRLYNRNKLLIDVNIEPCIRLIDRFYFDNYLWDYYKRIGGTTFENGQIKNIDFENKSIYLTAGDVIRYKYLIAADGANSLVEKLSGNRKNRNALCLEVNVKREDYNVNGVNVYFNIVPNSYAWVFSKGSTVCIGLVKLWNKKFNALNTFSDFLELLNVKNRDKYKVEGAMLPFGNYMNNPTYLHSVLFVGDAGGFVEPLTGEGIYYALKTGNLAGQSILQDVCNPVTDTYTEMCKPIIKVLKNTNRYQNMLSSSLFMKLFCENIHKHKNFVQYFYNTHVNRCSTENIWTTYLKSIHLY